MGINVKDFGALGDGIADDRAACQAAIDYAQGNGGGDVIFPTGRYKIVGVLSGETGVSAKLNGLVVRFQGFTVENRVRLIADGNASLICASSNMILIRASNPGTEILGMDLNGGENYWDGVLTNNWAVGFVAEDRTVGAAICSQSYCRVIGNHIHQTDEGIVIEPGYTVAGSDSGCFYGVIERNDMNFNRRAIWFRPAINTTANRPTRWGAAWNRIERGNTGIDLFHCTETTMIGNNFQFLEASRSATPYASGNAIHVGALSENNYVYGGNAEACDFVVFNEGALPNALIAEDFALTGVSGGAMYNFMPYRQHHQIRMARRTAAYEPIGIIANHNGFARLVFDYTGTGVRDASIETNSVRRMGWFNGKTTHYGSLGNVELMSNGAQINFTRAGGNTISSPSNGTMAIQGLGGITWTQCTGSPEGQITAPVGSLCTRTDGGAGSTLYVKQNGAGNTGWVAK